MCSGQGPGSGVEGRVGRVFQTRSCCCCFCCSWRRLDYARLLLVAASIASSLGHGLRIRIPDSGYRTAGKIVDEGKGGVGLEATAFSSICDV